MVSEARVGVVRRPQERRFVQTKEYRRFMECCEECRASRSIGLCYGAAGVGKTEATRKYAQWDEIEPLLSWHGVVQPRLSADNPRPCVALYTPTATVTARQIEKDIALLCWSLRIIGEASCAVPQAVETVEGMVRPGQIDLLVVDEADRLKPQALEVLRDSSDRSPMGLVLVGMPGRAGGFIGSHLVELWSARGTRSARSSATTAGTTAGQVDRLPAEVRAAVEVHRGDLKDPEAVRKAVEGRAWVFHLGALIAIPYSYQNPLDVVQTNVVGTAHVLDACRANPALERVVLTSTSEVYGTAQYVPIDETHPLRGQSPYAATKIGSDALGESYHRAFGLPVAILRPFNTFGPRQSARAIIPTIISQALDPPEDPAGEPRPAARPDLRQGHRRRLPGDRRLRRRDRPGRQHRPGRRPDDRRAGRADRPILGRPIEVETDEARVRPAASEVGRLLAGTALAQELFGWSPPTRWTRP